MTKIGAHQKQSVVRTSLDETIFVVGAIAKDRKSTSDEPFSLH